MKKFFLLFFVLTAVSSFSQTNYDEVKLKRDTDYSAANKYALEAADYILTVPINPENNQRLKSLQFVMKWMEGTPDFTFSLDETIMEKVVGENSELLGIYMACMTKYCLENQNNAKDNAMVKLNAVKLLLSYVEKAENNIKMHKGLKKISEANKKGELEKALE